MKFSGNAKDMLVSKYEYGYGFACFFFAWPYLNPNISENPNSIIIRFRYLIGSYINTIYRNIAHILNHE